MNIFTLPDVGEGLTEADIANWLVKVGDTVAVNQVIAEIETAKSLVEIPSPWAGEVKELFAEVGDTVNVGDNFIAIEVTATAEGEESPQAPLVGSGPKDDTPGRRRRRGRPDRPAPTQVAEPEPEAEPESASPEVRSLHQSIGETTGPQTGQRPRS